jgi:membrane-bound lytic murein transglycosylase B
MLGSNILVLWSGLIFGADYAEHPMVEPFVQEMVAESKFDEQLLRTWISDASRKGSILDAIQRPAEKTKEWFEYKELFITEKRIAAGKEFLIANAEAFAKAEKTYGVPKEIIAAIIGVETFYGRQTGSYRVLDALATLAFDYPQRPIFWRELKSFFLMAREEGLDPLVLKGSYAGAMGLGQFIPSSYRSYAVDFDGDGKKDIWDNPTDAIGSVANYFKQHGWKTGEPVIEKVTLHDPLIDQQANDNLEPTLMLSDWYKLGVDIPKKLPEQKAAFFRYQLEDGVDYYLGLNNFYTITRYNHSRLYAMAIYQLSQALK